MNHVAIFEQGLKQRNEREKGLESLINNYKKLLKESAPPDTLLKLRQENFDLLRDQAQFLDSTQQLLFLIKEAENYEEEVEFEIKSVNYEINKLNKEIFIHEQEVSSLAGELMRRDQEIMELERVNTQIETTNALALENNNVLSQDIHRIEDLISKLTGENKNRKVNKGNKEIKRLLPHNDVINCIKFNSQGSLFVTGSEDATIKIFDSGTFQIFATMTHSTRGITSVAIEDCLLMGLSKDNVVRLWNISLGKLAQVFVHKTDVLDAVLYENRLITTCQDKSLKVWDIHSGNFTQTITFDGFVCHQLKIFNNILFLVSTEGIYQMDLKSMSFDKTKFVTKKQILSLDISHNQKYKLVTYKEGSIDLVDFKTNKVLTQFKHVDFSNTQCQAKFSPDSSMLACGSTKGIIFVWKTSVIAHDPKWMKKACEKSINCLDWSPSNSHLVCGTADKQVLVYDI